MYVKHWKLIIRNIVKQIQSLQNLYEYLLDAENQFSGESVDNAAQNEYGINGTGASPVPVAAGAGDTNICGGIIQLYWNSVLTRCLDSVDQVRQNALKVAERVYMFVLVEFF
jgi:cohesin loading factor subunit SCC2